MAIVKAIEPLQAAVRDQHRVGLDGHIGIESGEAVVERRLAAVSPIRR